MKQTCFAILLLLMTHEISSACGEGTLRCSAEDKPLVCDFLNGYDLNEAGDKCEKKTVEGCDVLGIPGSTTKCLMCKDNYVYDTATSVCVVVPDDNKVENCSAYSYQNQAFSCTACADKFVLENSACVAVPEANLIENCILYTKAGTAYNCDMCKDSFRVKDNTCVEFKTAENCLYTADRQCTQCNFGYIVNRANPIQGEVNTSFYSYLYNSIANKYYYDEKRTFSVCQKITIKNCVKFATFNTCKTCYSGYFLNSNNLCELFPEDQLANCVKYRNFNECQECEPKFYTNLNTTWLCSASTNDDNCTEYSKDSDDCTKCADGFFLNSNAIVGCNERTNKTIDNCNELNESADQCKTCNDNYFL